MAAVVPALLFGLVSRSLRMVPLAFFFALLHAIFLGLPVMALLWGTRFTGAVSASVAGFVVGSGGIILIGLFGSGIPTGGGWRELLEGVPLFGLLGAAGGWTCQRWLQWTGTLPGSVESADEGPGHKRKYPLVLPLGLAALLVGGMWAIGPALEDRSCHNPFRNSEARTISPVVSIDLNLTDDDWPAIAGELRAFADEEMLSFKDSSVSRPEVRALAISACSDTSARIEINAQRWSNERIPDASGRGIGIPVYPVQAGSTWIPIARRLVNRLEKKWPGRVRFLDGGGRWIPKPEVLIDETVKGAETVPATPGP